MLPDFDKAMSFLYNSLFFQESFSSHLYALSWQSETQLSYWDFCQYMFSGLTIPFWGFFLILHLYMGIVNYFLVICSLFCSFLASRAKQLGPVLKLFISICMPVFFIVWLVVGIVGSIIMGGLYGFLSPIFATFDAVGEGKKNNWFHCFYVCVEYQTSYCGINNCLLVGFDDRDFIHFLSRMELGAQ